MNLLELIQTRRTIHSYTEEKVSPDIIENSIRAAIHAPNHKMTWPWKFMIAGPRSRAQLGELIVKLKSQKETLSDATKASLKKKYNDEGTLIIATIPISEDHTRNKEDYASMACALQNMALYFHEQGYGSKWSSGAILNAPEAFSILGLDPIQTEICGFFWVGKARTQPPSIKRPEVVEFFKYID